MDRKQLDALIEARNEERHPLAKIERISETEFTVNGHNYQVVVNSQNGFQFTAFSLRFHPALSQYDYIVGDWGYSQLRLRGFYEDDRDETSGPFISSLNDYLLEDVNFGAAYFVVHNLEARPIVRKARATRNSRQRSSNRNHSRSRRRNKRSHAFTEQKVAPVKPAVKKRKNVVVKSEKTANKHHFIIRESKN